MCKNMIFLIDYRSYTIISAWYSSCSHSITDPSNIMTSDSAIHGLHRSRFPLHVLILSACVSQNRLNAIWQHFKKSHHRILHWKPCHSPRSRFLYFIVFLSFLHISNIFSVLMIFLHLLLVKLSFLLEGCCRAFGAWSRP